MYVQCKFETYLYIYDVYPELMNSIKRHEKPHGPQVERVIVFLGSLMHYVILANI